MQVVNPNRMELQNQKKKLRTASRGHKLLKDKQDALIKIFLEDVKEAITMRQDVEQRLSAAFGSFLIAKGSMDAVISASIFQNSAVNAHLESHTVNKMGVRSPEFQFSQEGDLHAYGLVGTSGDLDTALNIFSDLLTDLVRLAEKEKMLEMMALEIEKTRRRVNALEYRMIPMTKEAIRFIKMKLDEIERSNLSRLMKVKEIVRKES